MAFKKSKKSLGKKKVELEPEEEDEEPEEEEDEEEDEEEVEEEPSKKKSAPSTTPNKTLAKPDRREMEDMIEGHLLRATDLLRLLRSTQ